MAIKFQPVTLDIMAHSIRVFQAKRTYGLVLVKDGRQMQLCFMCNSHLKLLQQQMNNPKPEIVTQGVSFLFRTQVALGQPLS
jgi:hypothetical protein